MRSDCKIIITQQLRPEGVFTHPDNTWLGVGGVEAREADGGAQHRPHGLLRTLYHGFVVDADDNPLADGGRVSVAGDAEVPAGAPLVHVLER